MFSGRRFKIVAAALGAVIAVLSGGYFYATTPHKSTDHPESADSLLDRADTLAWGNKWAEAQPLYARAQVLFEQEHRLSKALYAQVSQLPPNESRSLPAVIVQLTRDLDKPEAHDPETRLRILSIRGMFETNFDSAAARTTWQEVGTLAMKLHHYEMASRAAGEEGIAAFITGDTNTAKIKVRRAWVLSKVERDPAATVRYASVFGDGLVQIHRYKEALHPLNQAISIAAGDPLSLIRR